MGQLNQIKQKNKLLHVELYLKKDYHHEINISKHQQLHQQVIHHNKSFEREKKSDIFYFFYKLIDL